MGAGGGTGSKPPAGSEKSMAPDAWAGLGCNGLTPCAALNGVGAYAGKAYFFGATAYRRYDWNSGHRSRGVS